MRFEYPKFQRKLLLRFPCTGPRRPARLYLPGARVSTSSRSQRIAGDTTHADLIMADFPVGNIPVDCNPLVQELAVYWQSIHPSRGLPGRRHFDPCDIPRLLPNLALVDVQLDPLGFTWRLMGTGVARIFGRDHTGLPFEGAYHRGRGSHAYVDACRIVETPEPRWRKDRASFMRDRKYLIVERAFFPLARDGSTVDVILGMILAHTEAGEAI